MPPNKKSPPQKHHYRDLPLIYSCSGCSNTAQLANRVAVELDRQHISEMSYIVGVGGGVPSLVNKATSGRPIIAIDGCPLHCVKHCLALHGVEPTLHYTLTEHGLKKRQHDNFLSGDVQRIKATIVKDLSKSLREEK